MRSLPASARFCLHYLPLREAIHLPILLYKARLGRMDGSVKICLKGGCRLRFGLIRLGFPWVSIYPDRGVMYENAGGELIFRGQCRMGNNTYISIGPKGHLDIGHRVGASTTAKLVCYDHITIGSRTLFGWDTLLLDTDFHSLSKLSGGRSRGHAPIEIGHDCWLGNGCRLMKRARIGDYTVVQAGTTINGPVTAPPHSVVGHDSEVRVKATGLWRNIDDDAVEY